jgi:hypothetical protein
MTPLFDEHELAVGSELRNRQKHVCRLSALFNFHNVPL